MTADDVETALVEAMRLWWRSPGGGRWPFASDGPWHLMSREAMRGDYDARGGDGEEPAPRPLPLTRDEVMVRDRMLDWLALLADEYERALVVAVVRQLASGHAQPSWVRLVARFPKRVVEANGRERLVTRGAHGLRKRYCRALDKIASMVPAGLVA